VGKDEEILESLFSQASDAGTPRAEGDQHECSGEVGRHPSHFQQRLLVLFLREWQTQDNFDRRGQIPPPGQLSSGARQIQK
jgi:hypothetical protein